MKEIFKRLSLFSCDVPTIYLHLNITKIELPTMLLNGHHEEEFDDEKTISIDEQWNFEGKVNEAGFQDEFDKGEVERLNRIKVFFNVNKNDDDNSYNENGLLGTGTLGINRLNESVLTIDLEISSEVYKSMKEHIYFIKDNIDLDDEDMTIRADLINIRDGEQDYRVNFDVVRMYL
jgi:hypothetical protein